MLIAKHAAAHPSRIGRPSLLGEGMCADVFMQEA
jgi:hypothetical protein